MLIVVDASVLVAVVTNEPTKAELLRMTTGHDLVAPASVHWEVGNAFAAGLKRHRFSLPLVQAALAAYDRIPVRLVSVKLDEAMQLADQLAIYAYDAYILACARVRRCPLISLDGGLVAAAKAMGLTVMEVKP